MAHKPTSEELAPHFRQASSFQFTRATREGGAVSLIMDIERFRAMVSHNHCVSPGEALTTGPDSQEDQAIAEALKQYSLRLPLICAVTLPVSSHTVDLSAIAWESGWRVVRVFANGFLLPSNGWLFSVDGTGRPVLTVSASTVDVVYGRHHTLDYCGTTVPVIDREALAHLAASLVLNQVANFYAQKKHDAIEAVAVDFGRLSGEYFMRSRDEHKLYKEHMDRRVPKPSRTVNWASRSRSGLGRMFQDDRFS